jgi:hypothetical protein
MTGLLNMIKTVTGNYYLKRELPKGKRNKQLVNLNTAKKVGIVYQLDNDETYRLINNLVNFLQDKNIKVKALGYVKDKYLTQKYLPKMTYDFFYSKNLNWYNKPCGIYVKEFLNENFDIFIDLSLEEIYPIKYISGRTNAKLKVGRFDENNKEILDLMFGVDDKTDLEKFIGEITHYLTLINTQQDVKRN